MPAAYTSPIPGIDLSIVNSLSQRPLTFFSIALSITLRLSSKALIVLKDEEEVYLTKNGYGAMVVMNLEKYSNLKDYINKENEEFSNNIRKNLVEEGKGTDKLNTKNLISEDVLPKARKIVIDEDEVF